MIGGPDPNALTHFGQAVLPVHTRKRSGSYGLLHESTGEMVAGPDGLLDGINATTNHGAVPMAQQMIPKVKWTGRKVVGYRWQVLDCGWSICWHRHVGPLRRGGNYGRDVAEAGYTALDLEPRDANGNRVPLRQHSANSHS
jgi:hypothetical protein